MRRFIRLLAAVALTGPALLTLPATAAGAADQLPVWSQTLPGWTRASSPTIADVDGDGVNDIVFGHQDGKVRVLRADGSTIWERDAVPYVPPGMRAQAEGSAIESTPTVVDLDGDGSNEVIVGMGSTLVRAQHGGLVVLDKHGNVRWKWTGASDFGNIWTESPSNDGYVEGVFSSAAVGDVDGDGQLDVVFGGWDQYIHALDRNGHELAGFPVANDDTVWSSTALFDVDGDGRKEIFVGGDSTPGGNFDWRGGVVRRLDWEDGAVVQPWVRVVDDIVKSSPAVGDIDGDGRPELVVATGEFWDSRGYSNAASRSVFAMHLDDGSDVAGWPRVTDGWVLGSPSLGDLDGDGRLDVVVGSGDTTVWAWRGDGSLLWRVQPADTTPGVQEPVMQFLGSPAIGDLDGDGDQDVAIGSAGAPFLLDGRTGARLTGRMWPFRSFENAPAIGNFGAAGWRVVFVAFDTPGRFTTVASYPIATPGAAPQWPMFRKGPDHLGGPPSGPVTACPSPVTAGAALQLDLGTFRPLSPYRVLDTREGTGGVEARARLRGGCTLPLRVDQLPGVDARDVQAVTLNVTATGAARSGYLTVFPCGQAVPEASNLNFVPGRDVPNLVTVGVDAGGQVCFYASSTVHVIADVAGWYGHGAAARYTALAPERVLDTRAGTGAAGLVGAAGTLTLPLAGFGGVPSSGASAVALNVTVTEAQGPGYVTVYPCGQATPLASNLNYVAGQTVPNHVVVALPADGRLCFYSQAPVHLVADVLGWFGAVGAPQGSRYRPVVPARLLDTRQDGAKLLAGQSRPLGVVGDHGVPAGGVSGVTLNVTVTQPEGDGYLTVYPCGQPVPLASNLNYVTGQDVPNMVSVKVGDGGQVCIYTQQTTHVLVDVAGYFNAWGLNT